MTNADPSPFTGKDGETAARYSALIAAKDGSAVQQDLTTTSTGTRQPLDVAIMDASGNQVTSFGGGTQYTEGDTDASITGTAIMWEDTSNTLTPVSSAKPLPVSVTGGGDATAANQTTIIGHVDGIETLLGTIDTDTGAIATSVASIDTKTPALGQALAAASVPVVLTAAQVSTLTPPAAITGFALETTATSIKTAVETIDNAISGNEMQVDVITMPTVTVTATNLDVQSGGADLATSTQAGAIQTAVELIDDTVKVLGTDTYTEAASKGLVIGAVRRDADTTLVNTTNEFGPLQMDASGRLKVEAFSGETLPVSLTSTTVTGTVAVTQSGTWDEVGINDSGNSITVDNGGTFVTQENGAALTAMQLLDDTIIADNNGFTDGTTKVNMSGYIYDEVAGTALTENDAAAARINVNRAQVHAIEDGTTRGRYATVTASNALKVDNSGVTQPVSGTVTANLAAGTNNIGDVDILSIAAGDNNIGNVDVVTVPADPFGANADAAATAGSTGSIQAKLRLVTSQLDSVKTAVETLDNAISGSEMQVDVVGALPAGTNAIGKLAANSGVDIGDVDVTSVIAGTGATNLGKAEDAAHTTGDTGVAILERRIDTAATSADTSGDYATANQSAEGASWATLTPTTTSGLSVANFTSGDTYTALTNSAQVIKASAGNLYGYYIYNPNATAAYVMVYNTAAASVTVGTTTATLVFAIPATAAANLMFPYPITFSNAGWSCAAATTGGGNSAPSTALEVMLWYK